MHHSNQLDCMDLSMQHAPKTAPHRWHVPRLWIKSAFANESCIMDVILNWTLLPDKRKEDKNYLHKSRVVSFQCNCFVLRIMMIWMITNSRLWFCFSLNVVCCTTQDCHQKAGLLNSLVSIDMSLLKLSREKNPGTLCWSIHLAMAGLSSKSMSRVCQECSQSETRYLHEGFLREGHLTSGTSL